MIPFAQLKAAIEQLPARSLLSRRWFAGKERRPERLEVKDLAVLREGPLLCLSLVEVRFGDGGAQLYQLPWRAHEAPPPVPVDALQVSLGGGRTGSLCEARAGDGFFEELFRALVEARTVEGMQGRFHFLPAAPEDTLPEPAGSRDEPAPCRPLGADQSNTSVVCGERLLLKLYRRLESGPHPEVELTSYLAGEGCFAGVPPFHGRLEHRDAAGAVTSLALVQGFVAGAADGWTRMAGMLRDPAVSGGALELAGALGTLTAGLHGALAAAPDPAFRPEPFGREGLRSLQESCRRLLASGDRALESMESMVGVEARRTTRLRALRAALERRIGEVDPSLAAGQALRVHGDYHLGQILCREGRLYVVDFEGEPARPLAERRRKQSPLRDVAGMLRSFSYAASIQAAGAPAGSPERQRLAAWEARARRCFLERYEAGTREDLLPPPGARGVVLGLLELEKALYELLYEAQHRPSLVTVPLEALERFAAAQS